MRPILPQCMLNTSSTTGAQYWQIYWPAAAIVVTYCKICSVRFGILILWVLSGALGSGEPVMYTQLRGKLSGVTLRFDWHVQATTIAVAILAGWGH